MITVDGDRQTFGPSVVRKAYNEALRESGEEPIYFEAWIKDCLWIASLDQLACYENSAIKVSIIIENQLQGRNSEILKIAPSVTILGAPVYQNLSGDIGLPGESGPDVLLIAPGHPPEVFLRITNLSPSRI